MTLTSTLENIIQQESARMEADTTYIALKRYYEIMKAQGLVRNDGYTLAPFGEPLYPLSQKYKTAAKSCFS